jgi:structural maintenance of chromosome 4
MEDTQIEDLEEKLEKYQKELKDAERESKSVEEEIKSLQHKIETAGGEKLKSQRAKVELFSQQRDELTSKLNKAQVQREASQKNIEKAEKKFKESEQELSTIDDQVKKLKERAKELEAEAEPLYNAMVTTESAMKIKEQEKEALEEEFGSVKKKIEELRATVEVELKTQLDELIKTEQECNKQIKKRTAQLEEYQKQVEELNADFMDEETPAEAQSTDAMAVDEEVVKPTNEDGMDVDEEAKPAPKPTGRFVLKTYDAKALGKMKVDKISYDITMLLSTLETLKPDMAAIAQYREKERDYNTRLNEVEAMTQARNNKQKEYEDLRKQRLDEFMKGFSGITMKLKEIYQTITLGGDAELELVDSLDPFSEGIVFSVRPPRKSWKNISNLSGGEKTLSSLALVFALHHFKPTPIYVMDEIDAALDFKNVSIVGNYIKEQTKNAQFIIISLRNNMFELADILVGIYKTDNCTKSVTIDPRKVAQTQQLRLQKQIPQTPSKRVTQTPARQPFQPRNI